MPHQRLGPGQAAVGLRGDTVWRTRQPGYSVASASDGLAELSLMESLDSEVDLIVSDLVMPEMGGIALAERVRDRYPHVPSILVSGYARFQRGHGSREGRAL